MKQLDMEDMIHDKLSIRVGGENDEILLRIEGELEMEDPSVLLKPFFSEFHEKMLGAEIVKIHLDLSRLTFINSSGLKVFFRWICDVDDLDESLAYHIDIHYSPKIAWQASNVYAMQDLAPDNVKLYEG